MSELTAGDSADTPVELILLRCPEVFHLLQSAAASVGGGPPRGRLEPRRTALHGPPAPRRRRQHARVPRAQASDDDDAPVAVCPVRTGDKAPPVDAVVCAVVDSSRYFVFRCEDAKGRRAYLGVGFRERDQAYDFKASIDDFVRAARREATAAVLREAAEEAAASPVAAAPAVDMSLKGGLKLSFGDKASPSASPPRRETAAVCAEARAAARAEARAAAACVGGEDEFTCG